MTETREDRPCITVAVTSSAAAVAALRWSVKRAARDGSSIVAVHVFDESDRADLAVDHDRQQAALDASRLAQDRILAELAKIDEKVAVRIVTERGPLRFTLEELAAGADLLVLGLPQDASHRELPRALAGLCDCPVVTVSADGVAVAFEGSTLASVW
jgi:Universal stress protein family